MMDIRPDVCHIFGAGSYYGGFERPRVALLIAADGGLDTLVRLGERPDIIIGDFDSTSRPDSDCIVLPHVKDDTDTLAAIRVGLERGCREFHIWGGTGGSRADHTAANLQCLVMLSKRGLKGYLHGESCVVTAVTDGIVSFDASHRGYISVFSASDISEGVALRGLLYPLEDASLTNDMPLGVSNEFTGVPSSVGVKRGTLLIYYS